MDLACSTAVVSLLALLALAYGVRRVMRGRARHARVDAEGASALLATGQMEMLYWALGPLVSLCVRAGVGADAITWSSLVLALAAAVALGAGHFGLAAVIALVAFLADALDGLVARATGTASPAGEVFDASVDRWAEIAFLGGLAVWFRGSVAMLVLVVAAIAGGFMVSYSTAKAEAMHVTPPRGSMRRAERATLLVVGAVLVPIADALHMPWPSAPIVLAVGVIALFGNASAARRLAAVMRSVRPAATEPRREPIAAVLARHQTGALIATAVDFSTMVACVQIAGVDPVPATSIGAACGAVTNFLVSRGWIFRARESSAAAQAARYVLVSGASLLLNTAGQYVLHTRLGVQYVVARLVVAVLVSVAWNFPMHRAFVFAHPVRPR